LSAKLVSNFADSRTNISSENETEYLYRSIAKQVQCGLLLVTVCGQSQCCLPRRLVSAQPHALPMPNRPCSSADLFSLLRSEGEGGKPCYRSVVTQRFMYPQPSCVPRYPPIVLPQADFCVTLCNTCLMMTQDLTAPGTRSSMITVSQLCCAVTLLYHTLFRGQGR
jgi:hypothetical protein